MKDIFKNKKILITGGAGSVGSEIVTQLLKHSPKVIRVFDIDENSLFLAQQEYHDKKEIRILVGDVRDRKRLRLATRDIDIIFHTAALKHVPLCEYNPFEAIKTNVIGTQNLIECAIDSKVDMVVNISTDKAVNPINTMGATKLLSERLITDVNLYQRKDGPIFFSVRFGNVLGSRGSVIPIFKEQLDDGRAITITDENMTRFMMSMNQAVGLIFRTVPIAKGGEIFILKMPAVRINDLAVAMIDEHARIHKYKPEKIKIKTIGIRKGEKTYEELMTESESMIAYETRDMYIVDSLGKNSRGYKRVIPTKRTDYTSNSVDVLSKSEIRKFLRQNINSLS